MSTQSGTAEHNNSKKTKFYIQLAIGLVLGLAVAFCPPPEHLTNKSMWFLGILVASIIWVSLGTIEEHVIGIGALALASLLNIADFGVIWGEFAGKSFLLIVGAFMLGAAMHKTGLLYRISKAIALKFPDTYFGKVLALYSAGTIISPLVPSITAKVAILAPFAASMGRSIGVKPQSNAANGLLIAAFWPAQILAIAFFSGQIWSPMAIGMTPDEGANLKYFEWINWFLASLPWAIVVSICMILLIKLMYSPKGKELAEMQSALKVEKVNDEKVKWSKPEKITAWTMVITLVLWMAGSFTGIDSTVVILLASTVLMFTNVITRNEVGSKIQWSSLFFIGFVLCLAKILPAIGINDWISAILGDSVISLIQNNVVLFLIAIVAIQYIIRLLVVSQTACITVMYMVLLPITVAAGINPFIIIFICCSSSFTWNHFAQNATMIASHFACEGGKWANFNGTVKMSLAYMVVNILGIIVSVPFWKMMGML